MKRLGALLAHLKARPAAALDAQALRLVTDAQAAARLRAYQTDPNVAALAIERTRDWLDRWGWILLFAGLSFTTVNVQDFVAAGAVFPDLRWLSAWLVEPMVMGSMLVLLRGEQIANRHGFTAGRWVRVTRWVALGITYWMNTGTFWGKGSFTEALIHSVPVLLVFLLAEALVQQRLTLTSVVEKLGRNFIPVVQLDIAPPVIEPPVQQPTIEVPPPAVPKVIQSVDLTKKPKVTAAVSARRPYGTAKTAMRQAFRELAEAPGAPHPQFIRPVDIDTKAGLPKGTAKRSIGELREWYAEEVNRGDDEATA